MRKCKKCGTDLGIKGTESDREYKPGYEVCAFCVDNADEEFYDKGGQNKMDKNQKLDEVGVGTKETVKLQPEPVLVLGVSIKEVQDKAKAKVIGSKVVLLCKHPKKEESIEISEIEYIKEKNIKTSTLWVNLDEDNLLQKNSAPAILLSFAGCKVLKDLAGKTLQTTLDPRGYLCLKAY